MTRPPFEVADVIHKVKKAKSFKPFFESLTWEQIKVLRAIVCCRTSALGGHRDRCTDCGYTVAISYNSCIMGSIWLWGVLRWEGAQPLSHTPFKLPIKVWLLVTQSACPVD
jgi:hypothetical protein